MSNTVEMLTIDTDKELQNIIRKLNKLGDQIASPAILSGAINTAARRVRTRMKKDAAGHYALQDTSVLTKTSEGGIQVLNATTSNVSATIRSKGAMLDIMKFLTTPNTDTGAAAAKVLNGGSLKLLEVGKRKAFVAQFQSGHIAIVQRKGDDRLPVKKLLSPAVPHLLGNEEVRSQAEALAYSYIQAEIEKRIAKVNLK